VRRIEKYWYHNCWEVKMMRGTAILAPEDRVATRQVRKILADFGVYVDRDAICLTQQGERISVAFIYTDGEVGVWTWRFPEFVRQDAPV
jgi:hypothetical protein